MVLALFATGCAVEPEVVRWDLQFESSDTEARTAHVVLAVHEGDFCTDGTAVWEATATREDAAELRVPLHPDLGYSFSARALDEECGVLVALCTGPHHDGRVHVLFRAGRSGLPPTPSPCTGDACGTCVPVSGS